MTLAQQYRDQAQWRRWGEMLAQLPLSNTNTVLDLGCGPGVVTHLLSQRVKKVVGVDVNPELIDVALGGSDANAIFKVGDVRNLDSLSVPHVNGI